MELVAADYRRDGLFLFDLDDIQTGHRQTSYNTVEVTKRDAEFSSFHVLANCDYMKGNVKKPKKEKKGLNLGKNSEI